MNKVLKRISITALAFLLIGTGLTICGLLLDGTMAFSYTLGQPVNTKRSQGYKMITKEIEPVHSIQVDTDYFDVKVISGKTFSITYPEGEYIDSAYAVENDKLTLTIQEKDKSKLQVFGFWGFMPSSFDYNATQDDTIVVTIPDNTSLKDISIHDADGNCLIEGQTSDSYALDLSYGDLALTDCTGKNVDIKDSDGDVNISSSNFDSMTGKLSYGDCHVADSTIGTGDLNLSDGALKLDNGSISMLTAKLSYGDFTVNHTQIGQVDASLSDGDFTATLDEAEDLFSTNFDTADGEITINGKEQGEHYTTTGSDKKSLSVKTSYGDINIQFSK